MDRPPSRIAALCAAALLAGAASASAQETGPGRNCRLVLTPATDSTRSVSVEVSPEQYVTYVGGGLDWSCGGARAYADSAVKYDVQRRLEMIGSVDYEDELRTLTARTVTYFESQDRIVADGDAVVVRKSNGARLAGPHIEFYRSAGGALRRTIATGRPRLRVYTDTVAPDTTSPTFVDADRIELLSGDEAWGWGEVEIQRPDLDATGDSAHFDMRAGSGVLYGESPRVEGRGVTLTGRTIRTTFENGELDEVLAETEATATGKSFHLLSDRIRARLAERQIERLWAFGEGSSVALASTNRLAADSLVFAFADGRIDTLYATGAAQAVEVGEEAGGEGRDRFDLSPGERSWVAGDTLVLAFASDTAPARDSIEGPGTAAAADSAAGSGEAQLRSLLARGSARAYRILRSEDGTGEPGRHYQKGAEILIRFRDGAAYRVEGVRAIGVHLDPLPPGARSDTAPSGTARSEPPRDSVARSEAVVDSVARDTASAEGVPTGSSAAGGGGEQ